MTSSIRNGRKKVRQIERFSPIIKSYYIFCEGEQTEPNYFEGFKKAIQSNPIYKNLVHVEIEGVGAETLRVINFAENYVRRNKIKNAQIWCVYDKDSFPSEDFNAVSQKATVLNEQQSNVEYHVAWSNQCVEYWFILHFDWYYSDNDRKDYRKYLHKKFDDLGLKRYEKNNKEIFSILTWSGDPKSAINRAQKRIRECQGLSDTDSKPATKVYELVVEIAQYLPDDIKQRYL